MADQPLIVTSIPILNSIFSGWVARIVIAVLILFLGFIVGKLIEKVVRRLLKEIGFDSSIGKLVKIRVSFQETAVRSITYLIYLISIIAALDQLGITRAVLWAVVGVIAAILVMIILRGIWEFVPNAFVGRLRRSSINPGDKISIKGIKGTVFRTKLAGIFVETQDKEVYYLPNSFLEKP